MHRTVKLFLDTEGVSDSKRSGRSRVIRTPQVINAVRSRIKRSSVQKQNIMARERDTAPRTMSRIIKQGLGLSNDKQDNALVSLKENRKQKIKTPVLIVRKRA